ncbi:MAG: hypothetical protein RDV41_10895, partial [Planctomycetota bacterium]|nr:hypothetical protein [Planctomycetota bacterium]
MGCPARGGNETHQQLNPFHIPFGVFSVFGGSCSSGDRRRLLQRFQFLLGRLADLAFAAGELDGIFI